MATTRLTRHIRDSILKDLLEYAFKERAQAQLDAEIDFATEVFEDTFREHLETFAKAPEGFYPLDDDFKVAFGSDVTQFDLATGFDYSLPQEWRDAGVKSRERASRRMPFKTYQGNVIKQFSHGDETTKRREALKDAREELLAEMRAASRQAKSTLDSVSTIAKLIDVWPEARQFAEKYQINGEAKAILPAIPRAELNARLHLPPPVEGAVAGGQVVA